MRAVLTLLFAGLLVVTRGADPGRAQAEPSARSGVAALLALSSHAWNHGDLDAFMRCYEDSPETVYIGAKSIIAGYANIRAHYAGHYVAGRMGTLSVTDLRVRPLGSAYALATARWHLARPAAQGGPVGGLFSLVLHRTDGGWRIIADHTP
jgi:uncharacterized protein (TIGR02246 family)